MGHQPNKRLPRPDCWLHPNLALLTYETKALSTREAKTAILFARFPRSTSTLAGADLTPHSKRRLSLNAREFKRGWHLHCRRATARRQASGSGSNRASLTFRRRRLMQPGASASISSQTFCIRNSGVTVSEFENIIWTASVTILGGVLVYVIGQLLSKFLIDPTQELKKAIGEVRFNLAFHAPIIYSPIARTPERSDKAYEALLKSSCELLAKVDVIPFYRLLSRISFGFLPPKRCIREAAKQLRGLSTYVHETGVKADSHIDTIGKRVAIIETCLNLAALE